MLTGICAYFGSYLRTKGQNLATKEDIGKITEEIEKIRTGYAAKLENLSHENRLRLAALEKRLQTYQEAYTLWWQLLGSVFSPNVREMVVACQEWLTKNCVYLSNEARDAFIGAYHAADLHKSLRDSLSRKEVTVDIFNKNWDKIQKVGDILLRDAGLPGFTENERNEITNAMN